MYIFVATGDVAEGYGGGTARFCATNATLLELLRAARARGCRALDGGGMVVFQAAASLELFTGLCPDRERMLRHFAELRA